MWSRHTPVRALMPQVKVNVSKCVCVLNICHPLPLLVPCATRWTNILNHKKEWSVRHANENWKVSAVNAHASVVRVCLRAMCVLSVVAEELLKVNCQWFSVSVTFIKIWRRRLDANAFHSLFAVENSTQIKVSQKNKEPYSNWITASTTKKSKNVL